MVQLIDLAPELLLHIALFLSQPDLLNVSLVCKRLHSVTEPQLYREYFNRHVRGRSIKPLILRLLDRPELAKYIHRVDIRAYHQLSDLSPDVVDILGLEEMLDECTTVEYERLSKAAVHTGVIYSVLPYEEDSSLLRRLTNESLSDTFDQDELGWYEHMYDDVVKTQDVPFDTQYCKLLRIGLDEALLVLLLAMLPNVREIDLYGAPRQRFALPWKANHGFKSLRHFTVSAREGEEVFALSFFDNVLQGGNLTSLTLYAAGGSWREGMLQGTFVPLTLQMKPKSTNITNLVLQYCTFSKAEMQTILLACAPLKSFYYSTGGVRVGPENFTLPDLVPLLLPHKTTLEKMYLDMSSDWDFTESPKSLGSLRDFSSLKRLDTSLQTWSDILLPPLDPAASSQWLEDLLHNVPLDDNVERLCGRLPPSLEELVILEVECRFGFDWDNRQIDHLVYNRHSELPNLRYVELVDFMTDPSSNVYTKLFKIKENANSDNDGFELREVADYEYRFLNTTVFDTEVGAPRHPTEYTKWIEDRYVHWHRGRTRINDIQLAIWDGASAQTLNHLIDVILPQTEYEDLTSAESILFGEDEEEDESNDEDDAEDL